MLYQGGSLKNSTWLLGPDCSVDERILCLPRGNEGRGGVEARLCLWDLPSFCSAFLGERLRHEGHRIPVPARRKTRKRAGRKDAGPHLRSCVCQGSAQKPKHPETTCGVSIKRRLTQGAGRWQEDKERMRIPPPAPGSGSHDIASHPMQHCNEGWGTKERGGVAATGPPEEGCAIPLREQQG